MIKIIISLILAFCTILAEDYTLSSKYKISYGYFGTIGEATADLIVEHGTYKIKVKAKTTGLVKILTRNRIEIFESTGIVKDGLFIPTVFIESKKRGSKLDTRRYIFDHKQELINLYSSKEREDSKDNKNEPLSFYTRNDILTLFFNLTHHINKNKTVLTAVGASRKNGKINVRNIKDSEKDIIEFFEKPNNLLAIVLNQRIFASKKGELFIDLNDDGLCKTAILKDVVMFGDIKGELISLKKEEL